MARTRLLPAGAIALGPSLLLWLVIAIGYWFRPDLLAALTAWPFWAWAVPGTALALFGIRRGRTALAVVLLWVVWVLTAAEEPRSLLRGAFTASAPESGTAVRVVSLNCSGGSVAAAEEVARLRPDIVLLQESPGRKQVEAFAHRLYGDGGHSVWGMDTSVLSRWPVRALDVDTHLAPMLTGVRVRAGGRVEFAAMSIRLAPPVFRTDLWSPACWREYAGDRRDRRHQASEVARYLERLPSRVPIILGGDMNAPAGDAALGPFGEQLFDCFQSGGRGWGNTVLNDCPVLRFDQVWASRHFRVSTVRARRSVHSDHRIVVCDLVLRQQQ